MVLSVFTFSKFLLFLQFAKLKLISIINKLSARYDD